MVCHLPEHAYSDYRDSKTLAMLLSVKLGQPMCMRLHGCDSMGIVGINNSDSLILVEKVLDG